MRLLDPCAQAIEFSWGADACLYKDHYGHRVLAEIEGTGKYWIDEAPEPVLVEVDGSHALERSGNFKQSLMAASPALGPAKIRAALGRIPSDLEGGESYSGSMIGAGWVTAADGPLEIDQTGDFSPEPAPGFPVPFFQCVESAGAFSVVRAESQEVVLVDAFSVDDLAALKARDWQVQNISRTEELDSTFGTGKRLRAGCASHLNAASWNTPLPENCQGLILRTTYDRFHGRQRCRILVDGRFVGWWYRPWQDREHRWGVSRFGIRQEFLPLRPTIGITIDPPAGSPLWSFSRIELLAICKRSTDNP